MIKLCAGQRLKNNKISNRTTNEEKVNYYAAVPTFNV